MPSDDVLAKYPVQEVASFYRRLGEAAAAQGKKDKLETSLASAFLLKWLDPTSANRNPYVFQPPKHLVNSPYVTDVLKYHRKVYLSKEKARLGGEKKTRKLAGLLPRLRSGKWDGKSQIQMHYESLAEVPIRVQIMAYAGKASPEEFDILTGLRGFQVRSEVTVKGSVKAGSKDISVKFVSLKARVKDTYDWNYSEYFTVPNPDHGKSGEGMIAPDQKKVRVYHSNAKRVEDAGLAKPFDLESNSWSVTRTDITGPGVVTP